MDHLLDDAFKSMSNQERRQLLLILDDHAFHVILSMEYDEDGSLDSRKPNDRSPVYIHHMYFPMLEGACFIERQADDQRITQEPKFDLVRSQLQANDEERHRVGATNVT